MKTAVFAVCSKQFQRGLNVAIKSLRRSNDLTDVDIVVMSPDIDKIDGVDLIRPNLDYLKGDPWRGGFMSFQGWALDYDRVVFMQSDELYIGDISRSLRGELNHPVCAVENATWSGSTALYKGKIPTLHTGGLVVHPKELPDAYEQLIGLAHEGFGNDQICLSEWCLRYNIDFEILDTVYSMAKRYFVVAPRVWNERIADIRVIHYVGNTKPWMNSNDQYAPLYKFWRDYEEGIYNELPEARI